MVNNTLEVSIDYLFDMLDCNNDDEIQRQAICIARDIKYISIFFQPIENKRIWENCAKILVEKEDGELKNYLIAMFEWLRDLTWPGAYIIYDRLRIMNSIDMYNAYSYCWNRACQTEDSSWIGALSNFAKDVGLYL